MNLVRGLSLVRSLDSWHLLRKIGGCLAATALALSHGLFSTFSFAGPVSVSGVDCNLRLWVALRCDGGDRFRDGSRWPWLGAPQRAIGF